MRAKIKAGGRASPYRLRKQLPEPVFGQIKQARGFPPVSAPRFQEGAGRVGNRLHRPQSSKSKPLTAGSVFSAVASEVAGNEARQKTSRLYQSTIDALLNIPTATIWTGS
jgi:hypothetical protein